MKRIGKKLSEKEQREDRHLMANGQAESNLDHYHAVSPNQLEQPTETIGGISGTFDKWRKQDAAVMGHCPGSQWLAHGIQFRDFNRWLSQLVSNLSPFTPEAGNCQETRLKHNFIEEGLKHCFSPCIMCSLFASILRIFLCCDSGSVEPVVELTAKLSSLPKH